MRATTRLKSLAASRSAITVPGAPNALFARVIESLGYDCVFVTGAGVANMQLGAPDIGLVGLHEMAETTAAIAGAVDLPLIVDVDTGYGNPLNVFRTVEVMERAGAAAIQIEDQVFPKRCGHFEGKQVIATGEMVQKVRACVDARRDGDLMIIARTDAIAVEGLDAALDRARAYAEAGADMTFVEAPRDREALARIGAELPVPQVANMVFGGKTPELGAQAFADLGFGFVLYANAALQAALKGAQDVLAELKATGSLAGVADRLASFETRQAAVGKDLWDAREARYAR